MPSKLFISYRRADSGDTCGRIYDRLEQRFGREVVFKDVDSIPAGDLFPEELSHALEQSAVALIVIGPSWLTIGGAQGRRLDSPDDYVRQEVERALAQAAHGRMQVIPVLVQGASRLEERVLPASIARLASIEPVVVRGDPEFHRDVDRLISAIIAGMKTPRMRPRRSLLWLLRTAHPWVTWMNVIGLLALAGLAATPGGLTPGPPTGLAVTMLENVWFFGVCFAGIAAVVAAGQARQWDWLALLLALFTGELVYVIVRLQQTPLDLALVVGVQAIIGVFGLLGPRLGFFRAMSRARRPRF